MAQEIELKLVTLPKHLSSINTRLSKLACGQVADFAVDNTYYDTPEFALQNKGIGLRKRKIGKRTLLTVKTSSGPDTGLSARTEWEYPYTGALDFSAVTDTTLRHELETQRQNLAAVFDTTFQRHQYELSTGKDTHIHVCVDEGQIHSNNHRLAICEIELELASGKAERLFDFALDLANEGLLIPCAYSKAARGYDLLNSTATATNANLASATSASSMAEVFWQLMLPLCRDLQQQSYLAASTANPLHYRRMRKTVRYMRNWLEFFNEDIEGLFPADWPNKLRRITREYSPICDLLVLRRAYLGRTLAMGLTDSAVAKAITYFHQRFSLAIEQSNTEHQRQIRLPKGFRHLIELSRDLYLLKENLPRVNTPLAETFSRHCRRQLSKLCSKVKFRIRTIQPAQFYRLHQIRLLLKRILQILYLYETLPTLVGEHNRGALLNARRHLTQLINSYGFVNDLTSFDDRAHELSPFDDEAKTHLARVMKFYGPLQLQRTLQCIEATGPALEEIIAIIQ